MTRSTAAIVTYRPDPVRLRDVLSAVVPQVAHTAVVDNSELSTPVREVVTGLGESVELISNGRNLGLSRAYNQAVERAHDCGADALLLLDHDTVCPASYVAKLSEHLASDSRLAVVGGRPVDRRVDAGDRPERRNQRLVQSSGSLFRVAAFEAVGGFDEALFIHHVDREWFARAAALGWASATVDEQIDHEPGGAPVRLPGAPKAIRFYSDTRLYYMVRNSILLSSRPYMGTRWKVEQAVKVPARFGIHVVVRPGRRGRISVAIDAIRDGLEARRAGARG